MNSFAGIFQSFCLYIHNNYFSKHLWMARNSSESAEVNTLSAKPPKWSNTLKQFVGNLRTNCLSLFDPFVGLTFKEWIVFMWSQQNRYLMEESFIFMSAKTGNLRTYFFINYRNTLKFCTCNLAFGNFRHATIASLNGYLLKTNRAIIGAITKHGACESLQVQSLTIYGQSLTIYGHIWRIVTEILLLKLSESKQTN